MNTQPEIYGKYLSYKMVNFVETFYNIKVLRMITEWFSDDMGTMYFVNVRKLKHIPH